VESKLPLAEHANTVTFDSRDTCFIDLIDIFSVRSADDLQPNIFGLLQHRFKLVKTRFEPPNNLCGIRACIERYFVLSEAPLDFPRYYDGLSSA
jgi:hypothetical protein